jgi:hypothetical protein
METNYLTIATEMHDSLAILPGWTVGELVADATGWSFSVVRAPSEIRKSARRTDRVPGFSETRHVGLDGTLTVTRL